MKIGSLLNGFIRHLRGERNASEHTIEAYVHDIIEFARLVRDSDERFNNWKSVDFDQARTFQMKLSRRETANDRSGGNSPRCGRFSATFKRRASSTRIRSAGCRRSRWSVRCRR